MDQIGELQSSLQRLVAVLKPVDDQADTLFDLPVEQLTEMIGTLAEDDRSLHTLPERTLLAEQLREQGFEELLEDFAQRQVPAVRSPMSWSWRGGSRRWRR